MRRELAEAPRPGWEAVGVAEAIERYWLDDPHEAAHRDTLVDLVAQSFGPRDARVLEVGCGTGLIYGRLVPTYLANGCYVGLDLARSMLRLARRKHGCAQLVHGDGHALPFRDATFDLTLCFEVLGHLPDIAPFLTELLRVTRRCCLVSVWPSPGPDIVDGHEIIEGTRFLHRQYSDRYLRRVLAECAPGGRVSAAIVSAESWVYVVAKEQGEGGPLMSAFPFAGYRRRLLGLLGAAGAQGAPAAEAAQAAEREIRGLRAALKDAEARLCDGEDRLAAALEHGQAREAELAKLREDLEQAEAQSERRCGKIATLAAELETLRMRRAVRWIDRFKPVADLRPHLDPAFQQLLDDSVLFTPSLRTFSLRPGENLQRVPYVEYPVGPFPRPLAGVLLAPILEGVAGAGALGIEVLSDGQVVARSEVALDDIDERVPASLALPPLDPGPLSLRVFVRDAACPVRLFEWQRRRWPPATAVERRAFAGVIFAAG